MTTVKKEVDSANDKITVLEQQIIDDADKNLLGMIDIDNLIVNPELELSEVAGAFLLKHEDKIKQGAVIGVDLATDLLK